jgi:hypothetical protein
MYILVPNKDKPDIKVISMYNEHENQRWREEIHIAATVQQQLIATNAAQ